MVRALRGSAVAAALVATWLFAVPAAADSVTYQANPQHSGAVDDGPAPPLAIRWAVDLEAPSSYPIVAGGKVFVTTKTTGDGYGTTLYALDAGTGAVVWWRPLQHTYYWSNLAYENGTLFALDYDGVLQAFAADTGAARWGKQLPGQYAFSSAPVATGGVVYTGGAGSGGTLYAVRETDGQVLWTASVANGDDSSPSVDSDHVYVSYACNQAYSFARLNGALAWHHSTGCSGGGGKTTVLNGGRLYIRDSGGPNVILDAASGNEVGGFGSATAPAFSGDVSLFVSGGVIAAERTSTRTPIWSFAGDGSLVSAPFVAGSTVYEGSSTGGLFALDRETGAAAWSDCLPGPVAPPDEQNVSQPLTGLGAGGGLLVVPAANWLVAYESRADAPSYVCSASGRVPASYGTSTPGTTSAPPPRGTLSVSWNRGKRDIHFGQAVTLSGKAAPGAQVQLVSDAFPFEGYAVRTSTTAGPDGSFSFRVRPDRNTAFKAVANGAESAATIVYVDVAGGVRHRVMRGGRVRVTSVVLGPRDLPYRRRKIHFYVISKSGKTARHIGVRRLAGKRGTFSAVLSTSVRAKHYAVCVREPKPDAWGRALSIDRTCGARRLKLG